LPSTTRYTRHCYLQPREILVLEFKSAKRTYTELGLFEANSETTAHYQHLAATGALEQALLPYTKKLARGEQPWFRSEYPWSLITQHIRPPQFPPSVHLESLKTGIDNLTLQQSHGGDLISFLAEFEFAFASGYFTSKNTYTDRWNQLLQVLCRSSFEGIAYLGEQLPQIVDIIMVQLQMILRKYLSSHDEVFEACKRFSSELINSEIPIAVEKGQELAACVEDKKEWVARYIDIEDFLFDALEDEEFFYKLALIAQENHYPLPTLAEVLDAMKLTLNQHAEDLLSDMQEVRIKKLTAYLLDCPDYPETISSSDNPSLLSQLLASQCFKSLSRVSQDLELTSLERKPTLTEMLAGVAAVAINGEDDLSDVPKGLFINEIIPDLVPALPSSK
jgi:hypothetical protein